MIPPAETRGAEKLGFEAVGVERDGIAPGLDRLEMVRVVASLVAEPRRC